MRVGVRMVEEQLVLGVGRVVAVGFENLAATVFFRIDVKFDCLF